MSNYDSNSLYSGPDRFRFVNVEKRSNEYSEEEINFLIDKAKAFMKVKPWVGRCKLARYIGVTTPALVRWSKEGRITLPEDTGHSNKARRAQSLYKDLKDSWGSV